MGGGSDIDRIRERGDDELRGGGYDLKEEEEAVWRRKRQWMEGEGG